MKINSRTLLFSFAWIATLTVGILVGRQSSPAPKTAESEAMARFYERGNRGGSGGEPSEKSSRRAGSDSRIASSSKIALSGSSADRVAQAYDYLVDISALNDPVERNRQLIQLIDQMDASQFQGVIEKFRADGLADDHRGEYSMLLHAWVKQDPAGATDYVANSDSDDWAKETVIAAWAAEDPVSAAAMVNHLEDGGRVNNWIVGLTRGMARTDPAAAMLTLQELPVSRTRGAAMNHIIPEVAQKGADYALDWLKSLEDESLRRYSTGNLAAQLTRRDPAEAGKWVSSIDDAETRVQAAQAVSRQWAYRDLDSARSWVESLPADTKTGAAEGVARRLGQVDPAEGARWVTAFGDDPAYDSARIQYAEQAARRDPQQALAVIEMISNKDRQGQFYNQALRQWARQDPDATANWILNNADQVPENIARRYVPN